MRNTLQSRLITLMILASIFLIGTFTAIQLNNQLERTTEFNIYRAKQSALIIREKLKETQSENTEKIKKIFESLLETNTIEDASLLDSAGNRLISVGKEDASPAFDKIAVNQIAQTKDKSRWLFPVVDKKKKLINLFIIPEQAGTNFVKLTFSLGNIKEAMGEVYGPVAFTVVVVIIGNIILGILLSKVLISPVKVLNDATKDIAKGNLDGKVAIKTDDELEELADTFNYMTVELKKMKQKAENANPLTKLPGNIVIQEEAEKRIKQNEKFVLIYCDLDNFKAFNDKYGVHAGDKAIMLTSDIFKESIEKKGKAGDFIGHEGGDDFLLLTIPERAEDIATYIVNEFDRRIRKLYSREDLDRGYIEAKARDTEEIQKFPIMTISLAGVSNIEKQIETYAQVTNIAAEVKKAAKKAKGSKFILDRRKVDLGTEFRDKIPPK